jgi:hypothetical protein
MTRSNDCAPTTWSRWPASSLSPGVGWHSADGGGIYNDSGTVTVTNCTFSGNSGSAILNGGTLTVTGSSFSANSGSFYGGGGIINEGHGSVTVSHSAFSRNRAARGGGIANRAGADGTLTVANGTFSENIADVGGAIVNEYFSVLMVTNSTFGGTTGFFGGGGIASSWTGLGIPGATTVINSTFSGNSAGRDGGIANSATLTVTTMTSTIIANSSDGNCGTVTDGGHNLQWPGTDCGVTIRSSDPKLEPDSLKGNGGPTQTIALLPGSPAIDAGDPEVCANPPMNGFDQRGYVRPGTGSVNCSIGAYEYNSPGPPTGCIGDCNANARVTVDEIITLVNIALGTGSMAECGSGDADLNNAITIDEILTAVSNALNGCPVPPTLRQRRARGGMRPSSVAWFSPSAPGAGRHQRLDQPRTGGWEGRRARRRPKEPDNALRRDARRRRVSDRSGQHMRG